MKTVMSVHHNVQELTQRVLTLEELFKELTKPAPPPEPEERVEMKLPEPKQYPAKRGPGRPKHVKK